MYLFHKRTESGTETTFLNANFNRSLNSRGWFYYCNLSNVLYSNILHSVPVQLRTVMIISDFQSVYDSLRWAVRSAEVK